VAVYRAVYTESNAAIQQRAIARAHGHLLDPDEAAHRRGRSRSMRPGRWKSRIRTARIPEARAALA
jgi:hypothetical protein